jgi:hypothetical protein
MVPLFVALYVLVHVSKIYRRGAECSQGWGAAALVLLCVLTVKQTFDAFAKGFYHEVAKARSLNAP